MTYWCSDHQQTEERPHERPQERGGATGDLQQRFDTLLHREIEDPMTYRAANRALYELAKDALAQLAERETDLSNARRQRDRAQEHADYFKAQLAERDARIAEYENGITWQTTCLNCARTIDNSAAIHLEVLAQRDQLRVVAEAAREFAAEAHRYACRFEYRHCTCGYDELKAALDQAQPRQETPKDA